VEDGPRISAWFWELLESSGRSLSFLCRQLEQLPEDQLRRYRDDYDEAKSYVNPCYWDECLPHLRQDCSEDHGDDFAAWVVMKGRAFYEEVRPHPEAVGGYLDQFAEAERWAGKPGEWDESVDRPEYRGSQRADFIASRILWERFGEE
jgi:hypothetical protein